MMSSICLAKTAVSFGAAASAMRTQPPNGVAAAPASNRRLVISVMVSSLWFTAGCSMPHACRMPRYGGGVRNAPLPIMHPSMATVYRHRVVLDEIMLMSEKWRLQIDAKGDPAGVL